MSYSANLPIIHLEFSDDPGGIAFMGWDTEGGARVERNLLRNTATLHYWRTESESVLSTSPFENHPGNAVFRSSGAGWEVLWTVHCEGDVLRLQVQCLAAPTSVSSPLHFIFPFDPRVTPITVLPSNWTESGAFHLPAIISAPDHGQWLVAANKNHPGYGLLKGDRSKKTVDVYLQIPLSGKGDNYELTFTPVYLSPPPGLTDTTLWNVARRGWFGAFQCSAEWGDPGHPFSAPAGMLANNVISDPASCSLWFYADQAFFTPELAPGINAMNLVRRTLEWWLDKKMAPDGEMICYWDKTGFLDANSGPIIAAWDYVETTGDLEWLARYIERIERLAEFLARHDRDGDGLVEAKQSGNYGTLQQPGRSCAWWDALNCGHKDSYSNALIYRAWRCLADLESKLGRIPEKQRYTSLADRLKETFFPTLYNPETGWLAWWKSKDGVLHDYASPVINGMAIEYGLVPHEKAVPILERLWKKIEETGFDRFDLGIPPMLIPVRRDDYLQPDGLGIPQQEDGADTFGYYMNGGITAGQVLHFLAAHYAVGLGDRAERVLAAMLKRQAEGGFQNGAVNAYPHGMDWTTWDGRPSGYEGYLADSFRYLQAVVLREAVFRERLYRPLQ